jgi:hypothetical protein
VIAPLWPTRTEIKIMAVETMIKCGVVREWHTWEETAEEVRDSLVHQYLNDEIDFQDTQFRRSGPYIQADIILKNGTKYVFRFPGDFGDLIMEAVNAG